MGKGRLAVPTFPFEQDVRVDQMATLRNDAVRIITQLAGTT
jgi:hypothetical protein